MNAWSWLHESGERILQTWAMAGGIWLLLLVLARRFKIQRTDFDAGLLRHELLYSSLTLGASALTIGILGRVARSLSGVLSEAELAGLRSSV